MRVGFERTGERRSAVRVQRERFDDVVMHPATGFDAWLSHDLVHFVVERECGLRDGVFGMLAAGGNAFTFRSAADTRSRAWARRAARANAGRGGQLPESEAIASAADRAWHARAGRSRGDVAPTPGRGLDGAHCTSEWSPAHACDADGNPLRRERAAGGARVRRPLRVLVRAGAG